MATNRKQGKGTVLQWTNATGSAVSSNDFVLLGDQGLCGVALHDIANAASGSVEVPGMMVFETSVKGHDGSANAAISAYDKVYFTAGEAFCDVDTNATFIGFTLGSVASGATETENVLLMGPIA